MSPSSGTSEAHSLIAPQALLDKEYLKSRSKLIDQKRAQDFGHGNPPKGGTVYLTAADASGMMVSYIQSNYMGFGSGVVVDGVSLSGGKLHPGGQGEGAFTATLTARAFVHQAPPSATRAS